MWESLSSKTQRVSFNHCFTGSNCLTTAVRAPDGTIILTFNSKTPRVSFNHCFTGSNCLTRIIFPSGALTAVVRQLLPAKQWLKETRRVLLLNVRMIVPSGALTAVVRQLLPVKQWLKETNPSSFFQSLFHRQQLSYNSRQSTRRDNNSQI
jgi:hypothetical protein